MKRIVILVAIVVAIVLLLVFGVFGGGFGNGAASGPPDENARKVAAEVQKESQEFLVASFNGSMDLVIEAKGKSVVFTYTCLRDVDGINGYKESLEEATTLLGSAYEKALEKLNAAGVASPSVVVEYYTMENQKLIYSYTYK